MNKMTQYLKDVATLECQLYTQDRLLNTLKIKLEQLGYAASIEEPKDNSSKTGILSLVFCFFGIVISLTIPVMLLSMLLAVITDIRNFWQTAFEFYFVIIVIATVIAYRVDARENAAKKKLYEEKMVKYQAALQADKQRVERELVWRQEMVDQWYQVKEKRMETKQSLDSLYAVGPVHAKYRNLVAISTFYDYFDTGRCISLTGPGGAYDTYEYETRLGRIETKLDVIITKLDEIIANQQYLGDLMREANSTLYRIEKQNDRMMKSMDRIQENTELTEYNTRCAAQSAAIMEHIAVYHALKYE